MKYVLINIDTNKIENIIIWDGIAPIDLASNVKIEVCTNEHENEWSMQNFIKATELNEEQQLLKLLLEKYGNNF